MCEWRPRPGNTPSITCRHGRSCRRTMWNMVGISGSYMHLFLVVIVLAACPSWAHQDAGGIRCAHEQPFVQQLQKQYVDSFKLALAVQASKEADAQTPTRQQQLAAFLKNSRPAPVRIVPIYKLDDSDYLPSLGPNAKKVITDVYMPAAIKVLQKFLSVRVQPRGKLRSRLAAGAQCGASSIDAAHSNPAGGAGVANADLVVYVVAKQADGCPDGAAAWSLSCDYDAVTLRPTFAAINICPYTMDPSSIVEANLATMVHELHHALGFEPELYTSFYSSTTGVPHPNPIRTSGGRTFLATPKVTALARQHFGCPSMLGGPLEDYGMQLGQPAAHWEQLLLNHELMQSAVAEDSQRLRMTNFTMSLMEDSGWYQANHSAAQAMEWGYQAGCDFIAASTSAAGCSAYATAHPRQNMVCRATAAFKAGQGTEGCSYDARAVGTCSNTMPDSLTDGCQLPTNSYSLDPTTCMDASSWDASQKSSFAAVGGAVGVSTSRCYNLEGAPACAKAAKAGAAPVCTQSTYLCAKTSCVSGVPQVLVGLAGGKQAQTACNQDVIDLAKALPGHFTSGQLRCPSSNVCLALDCGRCAMGYCWQGRCKCHLEASGAACDTSVINSAQVKAMGYRQYSDQ